MSFCKIDVFVFEKETQRILVYRLSEADLCCCKNCPFANEQAWLKVHFTQSKFFNLEIENKLDDYNGEYGRQLAQKILDVIKLKYEGTFRLNFEKLRKIRIVKQQLPWVTCLKKQEERYSAIMTNKEVEAIETLMGLQIL